MDGFLDTRYSTPIRQVLINSIGATTDVELRQAEGASLGRMAAIVEGNNPMPGNFDAAHLKSIHKELLQDIYPWAGENRGWGQFQGEKNIAQGTLFFAPYQQIDTRLNLLSDQLKQENQLKGLDKDQFVDRLAYYADQYNYVHAFREGNGRTLQVVLAEIGRGAGYAIRLDEQQVQRYNPARDAAILRKDGMKPAENLAPLRTLLRAATTEAPGEQAQALRNPDLARPLQQQSPAMQQAEALRAIIVGSREVAEELVMQRLVKHNFSVDSQYTDNAKSQEGGLVRQAQNVQREPATWPAFREQLLKRATLVETDPDVGRASLAHIANLKTAGVQLDKNQALTPAFQEREIPADQLSKLGLPLERLWKHGQMEKLLTGQRSDQLPFTMPNAQGQPQHVPLQLKVQRDPAGKPALRVYLPADVAQAMQVRTDPDKPTTATVTPNKQPAPTTSEPTTKQAQGPKPETPKPETPKPETPKPKRKGPKR